MGLLIRSISIWVITLGLYMILEVDANIPVPVPNIKPLIKMGAIVIHEMCATRSSYITISRDASSNAQQLHQSDIINGILRETGSNIGYRFAHGDNTNPVPVAKHKCNVIFMDDYASLLRILSPENIKQYDLAGYYLLVITSINDDNLKYLLPKIFQFAWKEHIININVLVILIRQSGLLAFMYSYYPFKSIRKCGDTTPRLLLTMNQTHYITKVPNWYPTKLKNFNRCPIYVGAYEAPPFLKVYQYKNGTVDIQGLEADLLKTLANRLNFTVVIKIPDDPHNEATYFSNSTNSGVIKLLEENETNLTVGSWILTQRRLSVMDATTNHYQSALVFVIPPGEPYSSFHKLFLPFDPIVWLIIVLQLIIGVIVIAMLKFVSKPLRNFIIGRKNNSPLLNLVSIALDGTMRHVPGRNFARTLVMLWMTSCLVMRNLYQGTLFTYLKGHANFSAADTIDVMIERDFKLYVPESGMALIKSIPNIQDRIVSYAEHELDYYMLAVKNYGFKGALLALREYVAYLNYKNKFGKQYLFSKDTVLTFPFTMYLPKGSYLKTPLNRELADYFSAGLITHWKYANIDTSFSKPEPVSPDPIKMKFDHIAGGYFMCMLLLGLSLIVFALEMLSKRVKWIKLALDTYHNS